MSTVLVSDEIFLPSAQVLSEQDATATDALTMRPSLLEPA